MLFQPRLKLLLGKGGKYTLIVHTTVPDGCYFAGPINPGLPGGVVGIPEVTYFTAAIQKHSGICTTALKDVVHIVEDFELPDGKMGVSVATTFNGLVVGTGYVSKAIFEMVALSSDPANKPLPGVLLGDEVYATVIGGIIGNYRFIVTASAMVGTPGYTATLSKAEPQGINPSILIMDMHLQPPTQPVIQIPSKVTAFYHEDDYTGDYTDVMVRLNTQHVTVPIIMIYGFGEAKVAAPIYKELFR